MFRLLSIGFISFFSILSMGIFSELYGKSDRSNDTLARAQRILTDAMKANNIRQRVASENMANNQTPDYIPKDVEMQTKGDTVSIKKITRDRRKMTKKYDPTHPKADAQGNINMPKLDPLIVMMDMHHIKLENERAMKSYQMTTDMRQRTLQMMN